MRRATKEVHCIMGTTYGWFIRQDLVKNGKVRRLAGLAGQRRLPKDMMFSK